MPWTILQNLAHSILETLHASAACHILAPKLYRGDTALRRIFVSHGAKTAEAIALRTKVLNALKDCNFEVLEQERLEDSPGDNWPAMLDRWIAECDGAVILFCPDAFKSAWVQAETVRLCFRKSCSTEWPLIPVAVMPTVPDDLPPYLRETTDLPWIQWWKGWTKPNLVTEIAEHFDRTIPFVPATDPIIGLTLSVIGRLKPVEERCYDEVGAFLDIDLHRWDFRHSRPSRLIQVLSDSEVTLTKVARALRLLHPLDRKARSEIFETIVLMRLNLGTLGRIPEIVRNDDPHRRVFGLTTGRVQMAQWQVRRPFRFGSGTDYIEYRIGRRSPDNPAPDIGAEIFSQMRASNESTGYCDDPIEAEDLKRLAKQDFDPPAIAIVPMPGDYASALSSLREQFPHMAYSIYGASEEGFAHDILGKEMQAQEQSLVDDINLAKQALREP